MVKNIERWPRAGYCCYVAITDTFQLVNEQLPRRVARMHD